MTNLQAAKHCKAKKGVGDIHHILLPLKRVCSKGAAAKGQKIFNLFHGWCPPRRNQKNTFSPVSSHKSTAINRWEDQPPQDCWKNIPTTAAALQIQQKFGLSCWLLFLLNKIQTLKAIEWWRKPLCLSCNPVLLTHDLMQSFRAHTFSSREDPWPNFSFRVAYAHIIATQCKSCFRIASASACLELSSATASATFRYAGFSLRKRNSRTSPLCNFIMEVFDAAQLSFSIGWKKASTERTWRLLIAPLARLQQKARAPSWRLYRWPSCCLQRKCWNAKPFQIPNIPAPNTFWGNPLKSTPQLRTSKARYLEP